MKILRSFQMALLVLAVLAPSVQSATQWDKAYDPDFAPLTKEDLSSRLRQNKSNAAELVKLIERSKASKLGDVAFRTVSALRLQYPNNPDTLSAFCWAYLQDIDTAFVKGGDYRERTKTETRIFEDVFARVQRLAPKHWLVVMIKGYRAHVRGTNNFTIALPLLKEAIELAPDDQYIQAFCWRKYGAACNGAAVRGHAHQGRKVTFHDSIRALETAAKIDPSQTATWLTLFMKYHYDLKNKENALRAKRGFLTAYPKERLPKLQKWIKELFALYPD